MSRKPFKVGGNECRWKYCIFPRMCMGLRGDFFEPIGRYRGWLIRQVCWHGKIWYRLPEDLEPYWREQDEG